MPELVSPAARRRAWRLARSALRACPLALLVVAAGPVAPVRAEPPAASFLWFPPAPHTGEPVSLVSTSIDPASPIAGFAWDLAGNGAFVEGGPVAGTSFSTPGMHTVRLQVTGADGLSSVATETIQVSSPPAGVLLPFPVVRIVGAESRAGARLRLLLVEAPPGARIAVACQGRSCPVASETAAASVGGIGTVTVRFRRFERALRAGVVLQVRVWKPGEIGKYTRLVVRLHRPPARLDMCLAPSGSEPIACPSYAVEG